MSCDITGFKIKDEQISDSIIRTTYHTVSIFVRINMVLLDFKIKEKLKCLINCTPGKIIFYRLSNINDTRYNEKQTQ